MEVSIQKNTIMGQVPEDGVEDLNLNGGAPRARRMNSVNINVTAVNGNEINDAEQVIIAALVKEGMIIEPPKEGE